MSKNVGGVDRVLRVILGLALLAFALGLIFPHSGWNWVGWIGILPLLTAFVGFCPAYTIFGIKTGKP